MKEFTNILLGWGIISPFSVAAAYLIRVAPSNDYIVIGILLMNCFVSALLAIALARHLKSRPLVWGGSIGYLILIAMVAIFVRKATTPIEWREPKDTPVQHSMKAKPKTSCL